MAYTTVVSWLNKELLIGAEKQELAYCGFMWRIPGDAEVPELKPEPKPQPAKKATKERGARGK